MPGSLRSGLRNRKKPTIAFTAFCCVFVRFVALFCFVSLRFALFRFVFVRFVGTNVSTLDLIVDTLIQVASQTLPTGVNAPIESFGIRHTQVLCVTFLAR